MEPPSLLWPHLPSYILPPCKGNEGWTLFDWDWHNAKHVRDKSIEPDDVEQSVLDPGRVSVPVYNVGGERRWALVGATEGGRVLFVIYTRRRGRIRIVTARDATGGQKRRYRSGGK